MAVPVFELSGFLHPGETFHLARVNIISRQDLSLHTHNYAELLWIEKGSGYHLVNGERLHISQGDLIMIRPHDAHTYTPMKKGGGITLINIAFPLETLRHFRDRYFPNSNNYFWTSGPLPYRIQLPAKTLHLFSTRAEEMMGRTRNNIELDSMLLFIFRQISFSEILSTPGLIPPPHLADTCNSGVYDTRMVPSGLRRIRITLQSEQRLCQPRRTTPFRQNPYRTDQ